MAHRDHHFQRLCQASEKPEWAKDPRLATWAARLKNKAILIPMEESVLQTKSGDEWLEKIHQAGLPAGPINTIDRALNDPHLTAREMIVELEGPSGETVKTIEFRQISPGVLWLGIEFRMSLDSEFGVRL